MIGLSGALMYDGYYSTCPSCVHSWARCGTAAGGTSGEAFVNQPLILRWSPPGDTFSFSLRTRRFGVEIVSVGT